MQRQHDSKCRINHESAYYWIHIFQSSSERCTKFMHNHEKLYTHPADPVQKIGCFAPNRAERIAHRSTAPGVELMSMLLLTASARVSRAHMADGAPARENERRQRVRTTRQAQRCSTLCPLVCNIYARMHGIASLCTSAEVHSMVSYSAQHCNT